MCSVLDADLCAVVMATLPGVLALDVVGPLEVFATADRFGAGPGRGVRAHEIREILALG